MATQATTAVRDSTGRKFVEVKLLMDDGKQHLRRVKAEGASVEKDVRAVLPVQMA